MTQLIGAHCSASGGLYKALLEGALIGATTVQLFTSNQLQWHGKVPQEEEIALFRKTLQETNMTQITSHAGYLINLANANPKVLEPSRKAFQEELERCIAYGVSFLNFHPGAALKEDRQQALDRIIESLLSYEPYHDKGTRLLLETTAGQGSCLGCTFEELAYILEGTQHVLPMGVCIDTCHIFVAGYDISTAQGWNHTLQQFDDIIGLEHLYALHLNDSVKGCGSKVDRHAALGKGALGMPCFEFVMQDPRTKMLPKYLETPGGVALWKEEIKLLNSFASQSL